MCIKEEDVHIDNFECGMGIMNSLWYHSVSLMHLPHSCA